MVVASAMQPMVNTISFVKLDQKKMPKKEERTGLLSMLGRDTQWAGKDATAKEEKDVLVKIDRASSGIPSAEVGMARLIMNNRM